MNNDVSSAGIGAWRIVETGAPWLDESDGQMSSIVQDDTWVTANLDNGRPVVSRSPGVVAAAVPASWVSQRLLNQASFGPAPQAITAALLSAAAVAMLFLALSDRLLLRHAALAAALFGCTTPVWSIAANGLWPHTLTVLGLTGMAWATSRDKWVVAGLFGGLALWGRLHAAIIVATVGIGVAVYRRKSRPAILIGSVSLTAMALASLWSRWVYGSWIPSGGYGANPLNNAVSGTYSAEEGGLLTSILGLMASPGFGLFVWTPALVLFLPALVRGWRECPDWARALLLGGLLYTVFQARINTFTGGQGFYGYRHALELLACAVPCIAFTARRAGRWARLLAPPVLGLQLSAIALGSIFDGGFVGRDKAWTDNAFLLTIEAAPVIGVITVVSSICFTLAWRSSHVQAFLADEPRESIDTT
jgi:hypothetical protein